MPKISSVQVRGAREFLVEAGLLDDDLHRLTELQKAIDTGDTAAFDIKALQGQNAR